MNNTQTKTRLLATGLCASAVLNVALLLSPSSALRARAVDPEPVAKVATQPAKIQPTVSEAASTQIYRPTVSDIQLLEKMKRDLSVIKGEDAVKNATSRQGKNNTPPTSSKDDTYIPFK